MSVANVGLPFDAIALSLVLSGGVMLRLEDARAEHTKQA